MKDNEVRMRKKIFSLLMFICFLWSASYAATNVTDCQTISGNGTYNLTRNISSSSNCIVISSDDVVFDCNYNTINFYGDGANAFYSDGYDNITVKNCYLIQNATDANFSRPFTMYNGDGIVLYNNVIDNHGFESGTDFEYLTNLNVSYSDYNCSYGASIWCTNCYNCNGTYYHDNNILTISSSGYGLRIHADTYGSHDIGVYNNNITTIYSGCHGIVVEGDDDNCYISNVNITDNTIIVSESSSTGLMLGEMDGFNISQNSIQSTNYGIFIYRYFENAYVRNGLVSYNNVNSTSTAIMFRGYNIYSGMYDYNVVEGNTFADNGNTQLSMWGEYWNNSNIKDSVIGKYWFTNVLVSFENSSYGLVNFTEPINSGSALPNLIGSADSDIVFGDNYVWVNGSIAGFNKSANVTLYNVGDRGFIVPVILRDGVYCEDCVNYTSLTAENVTFSVTGFSSYEIGDIYSTVSLTIVSPINTTYQASTPTASVNLQVSANDTIHTAWYEYDNNGTNNTFTPNTTFTVDVGAHNITVWINNTFNSVDTGTIHFTYEQTTPPAQKLIPLNLSEAAQEVFNVIMVLVPIILIFVVIGVYKGWFNKLPGILK